MHAFLLIGNDGGTKLIKAKDLATKTNSKLIDFPLSKIEDVRELTKFCKLSYAQAYAIYVQKLENASTEAVNAFLKLLEEPQENIVFILSAKNLEKVLPTIVSRCQIIKMTNDKIKTTNSELENFLTASKIEKLAYIDKFKKKEEAEEFLENLIFAIHRNLKSNLQGNPNVKLGKHALETLIVIKANGNVSMQLTNFAVNG